ncbi:MAG: hypothetical protein JEZ00_09770 [Anaerolineaceae bacterium]|nr:hypothetical protein [Anaerolineaceae bacterium]
MSYSNQIISTKSTSASYEIVLKTLPEQGFNITRRRDLANLVQASKEIEGVARTFNVSCSMGKETKINVACMSEGDSASEAEKAAVDELLKVLNEVVSA